MRFSVVGTGFPPGTRYWTLYYYDPGSGQWIGDGEWHGVNDELSFTGVQTGGFLACYCHSWTGVVSEQYSSQYFSPVEGGRYEYDIASGRVTLIGAPPEEAKFSNLVASYAKI